MIILNWTHAAIIAGFVSGYVSAMCMYEKRKMLGFFWGLGSAAACAWLYALGRS
jgi:hypothetical protein